MANLTQDESTPGSKANGALPQPSPGMFSSGTPAPAPGSPLPWIVAGAVVAVIALGLLLAGRSKSAAQPNVAQPDDPYSASLAFSTPVMSESTSLSGGKSTFIDGKVRNNGGKTLTAATVQVLFANDAGAPPQIETVPLSLIRTREPYIDTQPISAAPLAPGDEREFRLIFENVAANWNQQIPQIHVTKVTLR